jgi:hypothetical protein
LAFPGLKIRLAIDPARAQEWHRGLADELRRRGHQVSIALRPGGPRPPASLGLVLMLERLTGRGRGRHASAAWDGVELSKSACQGKDAELEIDLTGVAHDSATPRTLRPVYEDALVEEAAAASLLQGRIPAIGVADSDAPGYPLMTRPAVEHLHSLGRSLDNLNARLVSILARAADMAARGRKVAGDDALSLRDAVAWTASGAFNTLTHAARHILAKLLRRAPHWYVGWRHADGDRITEAMQIPKGGWTVLPDDGKRFYADPMVVTWQGRSFVFVEEFPYATMKGLISAVEIGPQGPIGAPKPVFECKGHLSYPFVFERDGAMWMIPESSSQGTVELYRAENFPGGWVHAATLITGVQVGDATIVENGGKLWLTGTVGGGDASTWDALHLWSADRLDGPWTSHSENPVLLDALGARPAGAFYRRNGELWRPAQDCTTGYGAGLALCRVTKLDDEGFAQEIRAVLRAGGADWPGSGLHTVNWAGGLEVVDGCRDRRR